MKVPRHADPPPPMVDGADSSSEPIGVSPFLDDDVMNAAEVAVLMRVGKNQIYGLAAANKIPHRRVGKHLRFSRAALMRWLDSCGQLQVAKKGQ